MRFLTHSGRENQRPAKSAMTFTAGWLAHEMGIPVEDCHFGYFDINQLRQAYIILRGIQDKQMRYDNCGKIYFEEAANEVSES